MTPFTPDQWIVAGLIFLLGLFLGMFLMAGRKWKRHYLEERRRADALATENDRLHRDAREMDSLRQAAARSPVADPAPAEPRDRPLRPA